MFLSIWCKIHQRLNHTRTQTRLLRWDENMFELNHKPVQTACFLWGNPGDLNFTTWAAPHSIIITALNPVGQNVQSFLTNSVCVCSCVIVYHVIIIMQSRHTLGVTRGKSSYVGRPILFLSAVERFFTRHSRTNHSTVTITNAHTQNTRQILPRHFSLSGQLLTFARDCYILFSLMTYLIKHSNVDNDASKRGKTEISTVWLSF